jgi:uncharacterized membrane-anchored protein
MKTRLLLLHAVITLAVLAVCNGLVWQKEQILAHGSTLLLKLAPVDPRSLMQGDYMALRYGLLNPQGVDDLGPKRGRAVIRRDANQVGISVREDDGRPLAPDELRLKYHRNHDGQTQLGANAFFFQEGTADLYARAQYGELKVAPDGSSVLVGLRDEALQQLPHQRPEP